MAGSNQKRNAYSVLGLHKGASEDEIKQAYVALVKKYDPELHTDRFMVVQKAFDALRDPLKRAREDIITFNFIRGEYLFSKEERVDVPDAKLAQAIQMLEQKKDAEPENTAVNSPKLIQGYLIRSSKNIQKKLLKEAIDDWVRVIHIDPTNQRAKNNMLVAFIRLGYSYANHSLYDEAIEVWEKAAQMDPDNHLIIHNLSLACEFSGRFDKGKKYWDETIRRWKLHIDQNSDDEYMKNCVIEALRHLAEWSETTAPAIAGSNYSNNGANEAPAFTPSPSRPRVGARDELEQCREILKLRPDDFDASFRLGQILCEHKKWTEAVPHLSELHRRFPRNTEVINLLGWVQLNNQETDLAIKSWERGLKLDPKNHPIKESLIKAHMLMGRALRDKGLFINALVQFKNLLRYLPENDEVHYELGLTYQKKGDFRSAFLEFQSVLKINPKHKLARSALSELKMRRA